MVLSTLAISKKLEGNGFTKIQAESIAETVVEAVDSEDHNLVTKDYLDARIIGTKDYLDAKITGTKDYLDAKIAGLEIRMIKWMVGLYLTGLVFVSGFIYFLFKAFLPQVQ